VTHPSIPIISTHTPAHTHHTHPINEPETSHLSHIFSTSQSELEDAVQKREEGSSGAAHILDELKSKLEASMKHRNSKASERVESLKEKGASLFQELRKESTAALRSGGSVSPTKTEECVAVKTGLGAKVDEKVSKLQNQMGAFLGSLHERDEGTSKRVVDAIQDQIGKIKENSKAHYQKFDQAYENLQAQREEENNKWFEDRARINREHAEAVAKMDEEREESRKKRAAEREAAFKEADVENEAFEEQFSEWRKASAAREEELKRRHEEEARRTQSDRKRREEDYERLFAESKRRAAESESLMSKRAREADEARKTREKAHAKVVEEEERMRKLFEETKARDQAKRSKEEDEEWDRIEAEARRQAEEAKEELRQARENEAKANAHKEEAEEARRRSFRYNKPSTAPQSSAGEREATAAYEAKHGSLEAAWAKFEKRSKSDAFILTLDEVPYVTASLLYRQYPTFVERQKVFKTLAKRWHPDKFLQKFCGNMAKKEEEKIMVLVKESFQVIQEHCQK